MSGFDNRICVVWGTIEGVINGNVNFLVYGDKKIRTYAPEAVLKALQEEQDMPEWFHLRLWCNETDCETIIANHDRDNGCYTRAEADDWANYWRKQGFGCVLIAK